MIRWITVGAGQDQTVVATSREHRERMSNKAPDTIGAGSSEDQTGNAVTLLPRNAVDGDTGKLFHCYPLLISNPPALAHKCKRVRASLTSDRSETQDD